MKPRNKNAYLTTEIQCQCLLYAPWKDNKVCKDGGPIFWYSESHGWVGWPQRKPRERPEEGGPGSTRKPVSLPTKPVHSGNRTKKGRGFSAPPSEGTLAYFHLESAPARSHCPLSRWPETQLLSQTGPPGPWLWQWRVLQKMKTGEHPAGDSSAGPCVQVCFPGPGPPRLSSAGNCEETAPGQRSLKPLVALSRQGGCSESCSGHKKWDTGKRLYWYLVAGQIIWRFQLIYNIIYNFTSYKSIFKEIKIYTVLRRNFKRDWHAVCSRRFELRATLLSSASINMKIWIQNQEN